MSPGWQSASGAPTVAALVGLNLLALSPPPSAASSITIDCVRNAPIPASDSSFVELAREHLEPVLDCAVYLARFKEGGDEFDMTQPLIVNLMRLAQDHNSRLQAQAELGLALAENARREAQRRNMRMEDAA